MTWQVDTMRLKRTSTALALALAVSVGLLLLSWLAPRPTHTANEALNISWQDRTGRELWDTAALPLAIDHQRYIVDTELIRHTLHPRPRTSTILTTTGSHLIILVLSSTGRLTIGIPTIYRASTGHSYLLTCLDSILSQIDGNQRADVLVLVFLADLEAIKRYKVVFTCS
jgi:hypothetical protein